MNGSLVRLAIFVLAACSPGLSAARAEVVALLTDGTRARADALDPASDADGLTLQKEATGIRLSRRLPWQRIRTVQIDGQVWTSETLRQRIIEQAGGSDSLIDRDAPEAAPPGGEGTRARGRWPLVSLTDAAGVPSGDGFLIEGPGIPPCGFVPCVPAPPPFWFSARVIGVRDDPLSAYADLAAFHFPLGIPLNERGFALDLLRTKRAMDVLTADGRAGGVVPWDPSDAPALFMQPLSELPPDGAPLRGILVDAVPVRSQGKADWDALAVEVWPAEGPGGRIRGTLQATLWGQSQTFVPLYQEEFVTVPGRVERIATWTRAVDANGPARVVLPLPRPLPEHDLSLAPFGELHVQLLAPGEGTFEASASLVPLRRITPLRDRNLVETRSRFFPTERTHDARLPGGLRFRQATPLRPDRRVFSVQP